MPQTNQKYTQFLGVALTKQEEENLLTLVSRSGSNKSHIVRKALHDLYAKHDLPTDWDQ